jgi:phosphoribosylamine--glycine ligase
LAVAVENIPFATNSHKAQNNLSYLLRPEMPARLQLGTNLPIDPTNLEAVAQAMTQHQIDLVVVGPEAPLVAGVHDFIAAHPTLGHIPVIGPKQEAAQLEGSKAYAKAFMERHNIYRQLPTNNSPPTPLPKAWRIWKPFPHPMC